ncbi:RNAse P Rpr2/Rpp21/SNM1 subunit domain family protein [Babesia bovis T2Bo]|uniref:RNAse P protein subunit domain containing protein n=1 Tax=Babesia bovis TaxID=5865 RepID=A7ARP5_BABBO|nr:RNAse P Rpr2/Rpp21/SNM1 subunit domain family protein [Babesia bovis T2Bo]EDO07214.1 RNAse P Rpr2/Rpp21/SNM1 subunit domain family protein [Babesia bovis T2Bo]|eukprot:XP_001610782.1 RNAse P protein subunit domain containing protein [Babesia bovis T2Bo]
MKKDKYATHAEKARNNDEAIKSAYANNVHVKRLNFLLDAAGIMSTVCPNISRSYVKELREIAQKHVIRLHASFKRYFCKGCNTVLLPGVNAVVRAESHGNMLQSDPGNKRERYHDSTVAILKNDHVTDEVLIDASLYDWMAVTCCICTRTRRTKLEPCDNMMSLPKDGISNEP